MRSLGIPLLVLLASAACGGVRPGPAEPRAPLLGGGFEPLVPRQRAEGEPVNRRAGAEGAKEGGRAATEGNLRERSVAFARALLDDRTERPDFGAGDLGRLFEEVLPRLDWTPERGLAALADRASRAGALSTGGRPRPGDIALFHNQVDADGNGAADDWHTGAAIVLERDGKRFVAVARTGRAPRRITAWPDGPATRISGGRTVNSFLRVPHPSDPEDTPYLAGQLYAGHIDLERLAAATER
jgi:hypothetical protein